MILSVAARGHVPSIIAAMAENGGALDSLLHTKLAELETRALTVWSGHEREAVIEVVRAADEAAFAVRFFLEDPHRDLRRIVLSGVAPALATLLPRMTGGAGLPFSPSNETRAGWIDDMLLEYGKIAEVQRVAELERYGLARSERIDAEDIRVEVKADVAEALDRDATEWLHFETMRRVAELQGQHTPSEQIAELVERNVDVDKGWFIRYDSDERLIEYYRERALVEVLGCAESEALTHGAEIGGRLFAEWRAVCVAALGRVFNHLASATTLRRRNPDLMLRNLLTVPVLQHDAAAVWREAGDDPARVETTISHLTLDAQSIMPWRRHHEIPAPFYIDVGGGWFLLPLFGGLLNPICGLVRTLRLCHPAEWDAVVGHREADFRADLQDHFHTPRFVVPQHGFVLRRQDGSHLTDADAAILDTETGALALLQLKWPDIFGLSPKERESRRLNLLKANEWVERTHAWIAGRPAHQIAKALNIRGHAGASPPVLLVVPRYSARFTGNEPLDNRAGWVAWPEVVRMRIETPGLANPLNELATRFRSGGALGKAQLPAPIVYDLHGTKVTIAVV